MKDREKLTAVRKMRSESLPLETILTFLRQQHTSKIGSIRFVHLGMDVPLGEAKRLVATSRTWSDRFQTDEQFLNSLLRELDAPSTSEAA